MKQFILSLGMLLAMSDVCYSQVLPDGKRKNVTKNQSKKKADRKNTEQSFKAPPDEEKQGFKRAREESSEKESKDDKIENLRTKRKKINQEPGERNTQGKLPYKDALTPAQLDMIAGAKSVQELKKILIVLSGAGEDPNDITPSDAILDGNERVGYASKNIKTTNLKDFQGERETQIMRHIITQLYYAVVQKVDQINKENPGKKTKEKAPVEFQIMEAAGKVFISSNDRKNLNRLDNLLQTEKGSVLFNDYSENADTKQVRDMLQRFLGKLEDVAGNQAYETDEDMKPARDFLTKFTAEVEDNFEMIAGANKIDLNKKEIINPFAPDNEQSIFLVYGKNDLHAEMKFISLFQKLEKQEGQKFGYDLNILGTRRACAACEAKLEGFCGSHGAEVNFTKEQGRIWLHPLYQTIEASTNNKKLKEYIQRMFSITYKSERVGWSHGEESDSDFMEISDEEGDDEIDE